MVRGALVVGLVVCLSSAGAAKAAPEEEAPRQLTDQMVRALFGACKDVEVTAAAPGQYTVRGLDRTVRVKAADVCGELPNGNLAADAMLHFAMVVSDAGTDEELATVERQERLAGVGSCARARAAVVAGHKLLRASRALCTDGFHPPAAVPIDLLTLLQPFAAVGPLAADPKSPGTHSWTVGAETLRISGTASCATQTRSIESPLLGDRLRSLIVVANFDVDNPEKKTRLRAWRLSRTIMAATCELALGQTPPPLAAEVAKAAAEAKALLRR